MTPPPSAAKRPHSDQHHGFRREDEYAWLRDARWREVLRDPSVLQPEIRAHLDQENAYTQAMMADTEDLQLSLFEEMKARISEEDMAAPLRDGEWSYYHRYEKGREYPLHCRRHLDTDDEQVILDVNLLAGEREFCHVAAVSHSPDHRYLAYTVDFKGSERFELHIRDLQTNTDLVDRFEDINGDPIWCSDSQTIYFTAMDDQNRPKWVKRHKLGNSIASCETLYYEPDDAFFMGLGKTESQAYIFLQISNHTTSETRIARADDPQASFHLVEPRRFGVQYSLMHNAGHFYILLREGAAKDGAFFTTPERTPERHNWRLWIPHRAGCMVQDYLMFSKYLVRLEMTDALQHIVVTPLSENTYQAEHDHSISFPEAAYQVALVRGFEFDTTTLRFEYASMATPTQVFDYDLKTQTRTLIKAQEIPSGHDAGQYVIERHFCPARDGELVPLTLLRHKDLQPQADTPVMLYGYGSYGSIARAGFATNRLSIVERGMIYAVAHIRGGREKGYAWYESAKLCRKKHTFEDFVDAAQYLIAKGYTSAGRIIAHGASAGGMLMGVIANTAPDIFGGIVAEVPFVDVLTTMLDADLPLTPPEWPEWGDPIRNVEAYQYINSYSPYDQVQRQAYPAILALAGLTDPRVTYWEPAKWVARLRALKTNDAPLLLDVDMGAGHAGASGRYDALRKVALIYAFVLKTAFPENFKHLASPHHPGELL